MVLLILMTDPYNHSRRHAHLNHPHQSTSMYTLKIEKHIRERRHPDQEVQHYATVGVVGAVVVGLGSLVGQPWSSTATARLVGKELGEG